MKPDIFQELYDSEINFSISTFWDGGFSVRLGGFAVKLGDEMNGYRAETTALPTWIAVNNWLRSEAIKAYPDSKFAQKYRGLE